MNMNNSKIEELVASYKQQHVEFEKHKSELIEKEETRAQNKYLFQISMDYVYRNLKELDLWSCHDYTQKQLGDVYFRTPDTNWFQFIENDLSEKNKPFIEFEYVHRKASKRIVILLKVFKPIDYDRKIKTYIYSTLYNKEFNNDISGFLEHWRKDLKPLIKD